VTDGADYQYDVTFTIDDGPDVTPATAHWIDETVTPALEKAVDDAGHLAAPTYITLLDDSDPAQGLGFNEDPPRFSTGYMILENRPGMLVELHMLKDYKTRVTGNYEILRGLLDLVNRDADKLIDLNAAADKNASQLGAHALGDTRFPLAVGWGGQTTPFLFHGFEYRRQLSEVSGNIWIEYSHQPWNVSLPLQTGFKMTASTVPPDAYIIPAQWTRVIDVLDAHQVNLLRTSAPWTGVVETYRCTGGQWQGPPFEGRHPMFAGEGANGKPGQAAKCILVTEAVTYPAGSVVVPLNQRLSKVALAWLEPEGPDSAMAWGLFDPIFEQKEYGEAYVLEKLAREMMTKDPKIKAEFEKKVASDPAFASNAYARLSFFYDRSPWHDPQLGLYPVGRLTKLAGLPISQ
jgi:hypothetical protein